jgi:hypothetical protein
MKGWPRFGQKEPSDSKAAEIPSSSEVLTVSDGWPCFLSRGGAKSVILGFSFPKPQHIYSWFGAA